MENGDCNILQKTSNSLELRKKSCNFAARLNEIVQICNKEKMKKLFLIALSAVMMSCSAVAQQTIQLPQPDMNLLKKDLGTTLKERRSSRSYDASRQLTDAQLSTLLWAACGISEEKRGLITAPSAVNMQDIKVYVCNAKGAWKWNPKENTLTLINAKDVRASVAGQQAFVKDAPVSLVLVSDQSARNRKNETYAAMDAGYVSQNIYLACVAMGLQTVARAMMDKDSLRQELQLSDEVWLELNHPVGYGK